MAATIPSCVQQNYRWQNGADHIWDRCLGHGCKWNGLEPAVTAASGFFSRLRICSWRYERKADFGVAIILFAPIKQTALP